MSDSEAIPDRSFRERELYELREKGLAKDKLKKFEDRK